MYPWRSLSCYHSVASSFCLLYPRTFLPSSSMIFFCNFLLFSSHSLSPCSSRWVPPYPWHSFTLVFGSVFTSTVSSLSPPLRCYSLFFPISESGLGSQSQMRFRGRGRCALPSLQIGVSYCRLHAGINHLRFPAPLTQPHTGRREGRSLPLSF